MFYGEDGSSQPDTAPQCASAAQDWSSEPERFARLIVADATPVPPLDMDLLQGGLKVERHVRVAVGQRDAQAWETLPAARG